MVASIKFQPQRSDEYKQPSDTSFGHNTTLHPFPHPTLRETKKTDKKSASSSQRCWNCEEIVHRSATECPYCRKGLAVFQESQQDEVEATLYKIPTTQAVLPTAHSFYSQKGSESKTSESVETSQLQYEVESTISPLLLISSILLTTMAGGLLLLSGLILLFSDGISLTLEWSHSSWIPLGGCGLILGGLASMVLQKIQE